MSSLDQHLPALQVIVPLLTAPLVMLLRQRALAWGAATVASLFSLGVAIQLATAVRASGPLSYAVGSWPPPYGIELIVDAFTALLLVIVTGASSAALFISRASLDRDVDSNWQHLHYAAWLLALAGFCGIVVSGDAFNIFVFLEISSLATYILIAGGARRQALAAVFKYLILGTIGATFYLIGVGLIYMMTGTLNLADMESRVREVTDLTPILAACGFLTVGLALKAAIFPLHTWLPNAYTFAPHAVSVFIAACATKVSLYVLLRFDFVVFQSNLPGPVDQFSGFLLPLAIVAILVGSAIAIAERDLKRLLAYSSVAQVGYIVLGAALASVSGLTAAIMHMFSHALAKGALFMVAACVATRVADLSIAGLAGVGRRLPLTMAAFLVAALSLIGIPGTAGFVSKWYLVTAALERGAFGILLILPALAGSLLAVIYLWRIVESAYFRESDDTVVVTDAPAGMVAALWTVIAIIVYFGVQPMWPLELAGSAAELLLFRPE